MKLRWLNYESCTNPETGEHFSTPSTYRRLQMQVVTETKSDSTGEYTDSGEWVDVPEVWE